MLEDSLHNVQCAVAACAGCVRGYRFLRLEAEAAASAAYRQYMEHLERGCAFKRSAIGELACHTCEECIHRDPDLQRPSRHTCEHLHQATRWHDAATRTSVMGRLALRCLRLSLADLGVLKQHERRLRRGKHVKEWREEPARRLVALYLSCACETEPWRS